jgi:dTDP-4-amino-4,6-dideoxygalactose transaminase
MKVAGGASGPVEQRGIDRVPVMAPRAPTAADALDRLQQIDASGWYSNLGPQERELRERFASRLRVSSSQVATVANATLGLAGAVSTLGGRRWSVPSFTFAATPAAVLAAGAELDLSDIDPRSWVLDPPDEADGWIPVAPFGAPPELGAWAGRERVVHDAAASLGEDLDLSVLPPGHAVVFSLHATKVLGSGEGGLVIFGDAEDTARFRAWTNFGFSGTRQARAPGINAKLSEVQSAYVHAALDGWEQERTEWSAARRSAVAMADRLGLELVPSSRHGINPYLIAILADEHQAAHVERVLEDRSVGTRRWWSTCHTMPAYRTFASTVYPHSERAAASSLGLPMFRGLSAGHIELIEAALAAALSA